MIVRRDQKVKLISCVPLFQGCSQAELARVAAITTQVEIPEGEVLMREGEPGESFVILVAGSAEVRKGKRHIGTLSAGDFAGEIALLTTCREQPRYGNVRRHGTTRNTQGIRRSARRVPVHSAQSAQGARRPNRTDCNIGCGPPCPSAARRGRPS